MVCWHLSDRDCWCWCVFFVRVGVCGCSTQNRGGHNIQVVAIWWWNPKSVRLVVVLQCLEHTTLSSTYSSRERSTERLAWEPDEPQPDDAHYVIVRRIPVARYLSACVCVCRLFPVACLFRRMLIGTADELFGSKIDFLHHINIATRATLVSAQGFYKYDCVWRAHNEDSYAHVEKWTGMHAIANTRTHSNIIHTYIPPLKTPSKLSVIC